MVPPQPSSRLSNLLEFCCLCELNEILRPVALGDERLCALAGLRRCLRARACTGHRKRNVGRAQGYLGANCPESETEKNKSDRGLIFLRCGLVVSFRFFFGWWRDLERVLT
jgi:hypothetical protein